MCFSVRFRLPKNGKPLDFVGLSPFARERHRLRWLCHSPRSNDFSPVLLPFRRKFELPARRRLPTARSSPAAALAACAFKTSSISSSIIPSSATLSAFRIRRAKPCCLNNRVKHQMRDYTFKEKARITAGAVAALVIVGWLAVFAMAMMAAG